MNEERKVLKKISEKISGLNNLAMKLIIISLSFFDKDRSI